MQDRYPQRRRTPASLFFGLLSWLEKKRIHWEDRLGLFGYAEWIRTIERKQLREVEQQAKGLPAGEETYCFVVGAGPLSAVALEHTHTSLKHIRAPWSLVVLLPPGLTEVENKAVRQLVVEHPEILLFDVHVDTGQSETDWLALLPDLPGSWLIPLRAGDQLSPGWFEAFRLQLNRQPNADFIYWDEDQLLPSGRRDRPFFKPGWSPELLYSCAYLESAAVHRSLLAAVRERLPAGSGGWVFEAVASAAAPQHIPLVLQHRAPLSDEAARDLRAAYQTSVAAALERRGCREVRVDEGPDNRALRASWQVQPALVSIIIPTKDHPEDIRRCLESLIEKTTGIEYEVIVMDDHSTDPAVLAYYEEIKTRCPQVQVIANEGPFNYSRVNNQGARHARGDLLLFLNNDVEIIDGGWLAEMARWAQLPEVGMVGAKLLYPDGAVQHAGVVLGMTGHAGHLYAGHHLTDQGLFLSYEVCRNAAAVTGACMLVRRDVFEQLGGFDEELILVFNDIELGLRFTNHGWRIVYTPAAALIHYEGRSRSRYMPPRDIRLGAEKLMPQIEQGDRWYNPNLSLAVNWPTFHRRYEMNSPDRLRRIVQHKA